MQIIAHGFQTYGEDYQIDKPNMSIEIRMKRPGEQYSIYKMHDNGADADKPDAPASSQSAPAAPQTAPAK
jgi:hypothetical protein